MFLELPAASSQSFPKGSGILLLRRITELQHPPMMLPQRAVLPSFPLQPVLSQPGGSRSFIRESSPSVPTVEVSEVFMPLPQAVLHGGWKINPHCRASDQASQQPQSAALPATCPSAIQKDVPGPTVPFPLPSPPLQPRDSGLSSVLDDLGDRVEERSEWPASAAALHPSCLDDSAACSSIQKPPHDTATVPVTSSWSPPLFYSVELMQTEPNQVQPGQ